MVSKPISTQDGLEELRILVRDGHLLAIQDWVAQGKPLYSPESRKKNVLSLAVGTGFHSMVDLVAKAWPDQRTKNLALQQAAYSHRSDLIWLETLGPAHSFRTVWRDGNQRLVENYLAEFAGTMVYLAAIDSGDKKASHP